ncbi:MarR family transcriptional regulator [Pseudoclavibacter sp. RFBG4]|uniref:MarR family winged helix-turn-helix transcriptional regulator n=1 Tax=Pseudoclavibacter sp. RFBG4 TaxID=2080575 RepID=UPI000CE8FE7D|nr:MarR family transcriptional regulator [Pseudoclavibacter sp. RFBG4]PPG36548.1 MarR family transcriptional regulator [Pseudoclavibacter sp. RFBG4]
MGDERRQKLSEALFAAYDVVARTNDALEPALAEFGLTAVTAHLLWLIDPDAPAPSMRTAAERTHCTPQNVTFMCHQLEAKGLVTRKPSPTDLRQRVIELTPEGRAARDAIVELASTSSPLANIDESDLARIAELLGNAPSRLA